MLKSLEPHVRLLVTSRPYLNLESEIPNLSRLDIAAHYSDIRTYAESEMKTYKRMSLFFAKDPGLKTRIIDTLNEKADGM